MSRIVRALLLTGILAPSLHDGSAATLFEIFTKYDPRNLHGAAHQLLPTLLQDVLEHVREL